MNTIKKFSTRREARHARMHLISYPKSAVVRIDTYTNEQDLESGKLTKVWVVRPSRGTYLREDGSIR